jgi:diguanylate cyclase (GGDEF)-like protein/PAS domain S-box-containing protein
MTAFVAILIFCSLFSILLAVVIHQREKTPAAGVFALLTIAVAIWAGCYAAELYSTQLPWMVFWASCAYFGILLVPPAWLAFTLAYTGQEALLTRRLMLLLSIVPLLMLALLWSNPAHGLFYTQVELANSPAGTIAVYTHGPVFWVNAAYSYILLIVGSILLIRSLFANHYPLRGQVFALLAAILVPWIGNGLYLSEVNPLHPLDLTPLAFIFTGVAVLWALLAYRFLDIIPVAQAHLIANLQDGLIVLDKQQRVVEINPAAEAIFSLKADALIGRQAAQVDWGCASLLPALLQRQGTATKIEMGEWENRRIFDLRATPLKNRAGNENGRMIVLRDITERVKADESLDRSVAILEAVHFAATRFLSTSEWEEVIAEVLQTLGEAAQVSRTYIFENRCVPDGSLRTSQRYEWVAPGIVPQKDNPELQNLSFQEAGIARWEERLSANQPVYGRTSEFPASEHNILTSEQIQSIALAPIFVDQAWWGLIGFDECTHPRQWSKAEIDALGAAAGVLGSSIQRQKSEATVRQRAKELTTLHEVSLMLNAPHAPPELQRAIVEHAMTLLGGTGGGLYLCDPEHGELRCVVSLNTLRDFSGTRLKYGEGVAGKVAVTAQPLIIADYRSWEGRAMVYEIEQPFRSVVSAPLIWQDQVLGVLDILHDQSAYVFTNDHLTLLTLYANQAAVALHNALVYADTQLKARRVSLLNEITQSSIRAPDLESMLQTLVDRLGDLFDADDTYITFWDEEHQVVVPAAARSALSEAFLAMRPMTGEMDLTSSVLKTGRVLVAEDTFYSPHISPKMAALFPARSMMGLPLITEGRKLGAALIGYQRPHRFTPDEIALGEAVSSQISLAMTKIRLLDLERQRANELEALRETVSDISSDLDLSSLLRTILERATSLLNATGGDLGLYEETRNQILIVVSHNMGKDYTGLHMAPGEGAMGRAFELGQPVVISDYQSWEGRSEQYLEVPYHAVLAVPLMARGRTVGALGVVDRNPGRIFSLDDQRLLVLFAQQVTTAIENARLYADEKRRSDELSVLFNSSAALVKTLDLDEVYNIATRQLAQAVRASSARIMSFNAEKGQATILAEYFSPEASDTERVSDEGATYDLTTFPQTLAAIRTGRSLSLLISSSDLDPGDRQELQTYGIKSALQLPMIAFDQIIGYAEIWDSRNEREWSEEDIQFCQTLANQAAIVIENARLYNQMQFLAVTDTLTGIFNRRGLFERGRHEINRALRSAHPLAAILLDIDHFKHINDTFSHAVGDEVLRTLAELCNQNLRSVDIIGRYGGEEFAILLPDTDTAPALQVAERLRQCVAETPVITQNGMVNFTISLGVACLTDGVSTLAVLLDHADSAMYQAKAAGRNKVQFYAGTGKSKTLKVSETFRVG